MNDDLVVGIEPGKVQGHRLPDGTLEWAGIPYAAPPVAGLRFRPPVPPPQWSGVVPATAYAAPPPQADQAEMMAAFRSMLRVSAAAQPPVILPEPSEDCLYLNVWVPARHGSPLPAGGAGGLPVFVWIFGGGFEGGSATPPSTRGDLFANELDAVVVTLGYRVGALGYAWFGDLDPDWADAANLGLQDQLLALHWVRDNIAAFGGDPGRVTVGGASAGAFSIGALLSRPDARALVHGAVLHSGSTWRTFPRDRAAAFAATFLEAAGVAPTDLGRVTTLPVDRILAAQVACVTGDFGNRNLRAQAWGLVLDGRVIPEYPMAVAERGDLAGLPLLVGSNADEMKLQALAPSFAPASDSDLLAELALVHEDAAVALRSYRSRLGEAATLSDIRAAFLGDAIYVHRCDELADHQAAAGGPVWRLVLAAAPLGAAFGAFHGAEGMIMLGAGGAPGVDVSSARAALYAAWRGMVHHGDPGWARHVPGGDPYVIT